MPSTSWARAERLWRKVGNLALATVLLLVVSLSWAVAVDLTPADQRPYVGSSGDNSEMSLIIGYNGVQRLLGMGGRGGLLVNPGPGGSQPRAAGSRTQCPAKPATAPAARPGPVARRQRRLPTVPLAMADSRAVQPSRRPGRRRRRLRRSGRRDGGGMFETGQARRAAPVHRAAEQRGELAAALRAVRRCCCWPSGLARAGRSRRKHQALVLWGGWLLTGGRLLQRRRLLPRVLSVDAGARRWPRWSASGRRAVALREQPPWLAVALLLVGGRRHAGLAGHHRQAFTGTDSGGCRSRWRCWRSGWLSLLAAAAPQPTRMAAWPGFACVVAAAADHAGHLVRPDDAVNSSANQSLPAPTAGGRPGRRTGAGSQVNQALLAYLQAEHPGHEVPDGGAQLDAGRRLRPRHGRPVLYLGGFMGQDQVVTADDLPSWWQRRAALHLLEPGGRGMGNRSDLTAWATSRCRAVEGFDTDDAKFRRAGWDLRGAGRSGEWPERRRVRRPGGDDERVAL